MANGVDSDADDEAVDGDKLVDGGERIGLPKDDAVMKKVKDPKLPSQDEVDQHWIMGHLPYRKWCPICIKAQGRDMDHSKDSGGERKLPEYSWDYCFPGDELGFKWTVLVGKERLGL